MGRYDQFRQSNRNNRFRIIVMILLIALVVGLGFFLYPQSSEPEIKNNSTRREILLKIPIQESPPATEAGKQSSDSSSPPERTVVTTEQTVVPMHTVLPALNQSDPSIKQDINSFAPQLNHWFSSNQLISKYLTIVNDFSQGQRPYKHFHFLRLKQAFIVKQDTTGLIIAAESYQRFDPLIKAIDQLNINTSLNYYRAYQPLLQEVFETFAYPNSYKLDDLFKKAIAQILQAPIITGPITLIHHNRRYKFADQTLEALNPVHKQIIRMGPENTAILQNKLRQFVQALLQLESDVL